MVEKFQQNSFIILVLERAREPVLRPEFSEVHRAPFFKGLNLENPFKKEFEDDFEMTKTFSFPSFASQMDYNDYNPYEAAPVQSPAAPASKPPPAAPSPVRVPPQPTQQAFQLPELESFSEDDVLIPDMPPPGPSPPVEFLAKMPPPPPPALVHQTNTESNFYRTNYQQTPTFQRPRATPTLTSFSSDAVRQFPRSLTSFFDDDADDKAKVLPTTAYIFAGEQGPML